MAYLIFSKKHTHGIAMWWKPNAQGYTNNLEVAGRYSQEDAEAYCAPSRGEDIAVDELAAYKLATRMIVDMGDGNNRAIHQMARAEPDWAANRVQVGERAIKLITCLKAWDVAHYMEHGKFALPLELRAEMQKIR